MPTPTNTTLYERVKKQANEVYSKPSAYKSGYIVKTYKKLGGTYKDDDQSRNLERWYKEKWSDIGNSDYPVYRPSVRMNKETPLTAGEIDPVQLKKQIKSKQVFQGNRNLPAFKKR
jgi:hypothetical protein